jgi:hypothetical protein
MATVEWSAPIWVHSTGRSDFDPSGTLELFLFARALE